MLGVGEWLVHAGSPAIGSFWHAFALQIDFVGQGLASLDLSMRGYVEWLEPE